MDEKLQIILLKENIFYDDFDLSDIDPIQLDTNKILSLQQYDELMEVKDRKDQIDKLLFYLSYKENEDINKFLEIIKNDYSWLVDEFREAMNQKKFPEVQNMKLIELPRTNFCIHRTKYLWDIYLKLSQLKRGQYLIIKGEFGIGKKWLAIDVCSNYKTMEIMGFKIFCIDVGNCITKQEILVALKRLIISAIDKVIFEEYDDVDLNIISVKKKLIQEFSQDKYSEMLLVLTNVKNIDTLNTFDFKCKIMLTIKDLTILNSIEKYTVYNIENGFTLEESIEVFEKLVPTKLDEKNIERLHYSYNENPFLICLCAKITKDGYDKSKILEELVDATGIKSFDGLKDNELFKNMINTIENKIKGLPNETINYENLYKQLIIFTGDIPFEVLKRYWNTNNKDTKNIIITFEKLLLLEKKEINKKMYVSTLHCLLYYYLKCNVDNYEIEDMHKMLITNYRVEENLLSRTEPDLVEFKDDDYFYENIHYHLRQIKDQELINLLCLDFGFLDAKLRIVNSIKTREDLVDYLREEDIDTTYKYLFDELIVFLPSIEERLLCSNYTCLLQIALSANNNSLIKDEALKQIERFPNRLWFYENEHDHNNTEIIRLSQLPDYVHFIDNNSALVALKDFSIQFIDFSLKSNGEIFKGHNAKIIDIKSFIINDKYFLSLDVNSTIIIWSLDKSIIKKIKQKIKLSKLVSIQLYYTPTLKLYAMNKNGSLICYKWENTKFLKDITLQTKIENVNAFTIVTSTIMIILSECNVINLYNTSNSSQIGEPFDGKYINNGNKMGPICITFYKNDNVGIVLIIVYPVQILKVSYNEEFKMIGISMKDFKDHKNLKIFSCCKTTDLCNLILGTTQGGYLLNLETMEIKQITRYTDPIVSFDCFHDNKKYSLMTGLKDKNFLRLYRRLDFTMKQKRIFSSNLFDVMTNDNDDMILYVLDSNKQICKRENGLSVYNELLNSVKGNISAMCSQDNYLYLGYNNGEVYKFDHNNNNILACETQMTEGIYLLQSIRNKYLFIQTENTYKLLHQSNKHSGKVHALLELDEDHLLIIKTFEDIIVHEIINTKDDSMILKNLDDVPCDENSDSYLILANNIKNLIRYCLEHGNAEILKLNLSSDKKFIIGYDDGVIELYELSENVVTPGELMPLIFEFNCKDLYATKPTQVNIKQLIFSHFCEPLILITLTESFLCFWNISYIYKKYTSNKLKSMHSNKEKISPTKKIKLFSNYSIKVLITKNDTSQHFWENKIGSSKKEELLSCISFHGKNVDKLCVNKEFTKFLTIDDIGEVYYLTIINHIDNKVIYKNAAEL